jgi:hypothetical protein
MGNHPINLAIRLILEICALVSIGIWGWNQIDGWLKFILALGLPILLAAIWGIFNVSNDPSRSGKAPIVVPGIIRLAIELSFFAIATWTLFDLGFSEMSLVFGILVMLHYIVSYDRIKWLFTQH